LVNMVHQLGNNSFAHLFDKKVFAFAGVSSGRGGRLPGMQLSAVFEKLISFLHKYSVCSPAKFESHYSPQELTESGDFEQESIYKKGMQHFIDYNVNLALKFRQ
jgi:chromate reductase, NAD(P)H dehydrogenase (quinone)